MFTRFISAIVFATLFTSAASAVDLPSTGKITLVFDRALPNIPGKSVRGLLVEYPPGGASPSHAHPNSSFVYAIVLQGAIRSKVNDDPEKVYRAGESFTEAPGDHHRVSENASTTELASLLAVFVVDTDEENLVTNDGE